MIVIDQAQQRLAAGSASSALFILFSVLSPAFQSFNFIALHLFASELRQLVPQHGIGRP